MSRVMDPWAALGVLVAIWSAQIDWAVLIHGVVSERRAAEVSAAANAIAASELRLAEAARVRASIEAARATPLLDFDPEAHEAMSFATKCEALVENAEAPVEGLEGARCDSLSKEEAAAVAAAVLRGAARDAWRAKTSAWFVEHASLNRAAVLVHRDMLADVRRCAKADGETCDLDAVLDGSVAAVVASVNLLALRSEDAAVVPGELKATAQVVARAGALADWLAMQPDREMAFVTDELRSVEAQLADRHVVDFPSPARRRRG